MDAGAVIPSLTCEPFTSKTVTLIFSPIIKDCPSFLLKTSNAILPFKNLPQKNRICIPQLSGGSYPKGGEILFSGLSR